MRSKVLFVAIACICSLGANPERHRLILLAVQEGAGALQIIPLEQPSQVRAVPLGLQPHEIELARDGRIAYVSNFGLLEANHRIGTPGKSISVIDVVSGRETQKFMLPIQRSAPHGLKLRPPTYQELFVNTEEGQQALVVFGVRTGQVLRQLSIPPSVHNFVFDASGSRLYAFAIDGTVYRIDPDKGTVLAQSKVGSPRGLVWTADGKDLIASGKGELVLLNPDTLAITRRILLRAHQIFYPKALDDGKTILAPATLDGVLLVVNLQTGKVEKTIKTNGGPLQICLDPAGLRAWIGNVPAMAGDSAGGQSGMAGITELDLRTYATRAIRGFPDVNGIAVADVSELSQRQLRCTWHRRCLGSPVSRNGRVADQQPTNCGRVVSNKLLRLRSLVLGLFSPDTCANQPKGTNQKTNRLQV